MLDVFLSIKRNDKLKSIMQFSQDKAINYNIKNN